MGGNLLHRLQEKGEKMHLFDRTVLKATESLSRVLAAPCTRVDVWSFARPALNLLSFPVSVRIAYPHLSVYVCKLD